MNSFDALKVYQELNTKNKAKLVFSLNARGFASEINNMVLTVLFCLENDIEFHLNSRHWNASSSNGWSDYFIPFTKENSNPIFYRSWIPVFYEKQALSVRSLEMIVMLSTNYVSVFKVWNEMRNEEFLDKKFFIEELEINGDIFHAKKKILELVYNINAVTRKEISDNLEKINLETPSVAIHIRRGDKISTKEAIEIELIKYIDCVRGINRDITQIFISTDDYRVVEEFRALSPKQWTISTLCHSDCFGHVQAEYNAMSDDLRHISTINLLSDIEVMSNSDYFIGTYSSNISRLVALLRGDRNCFSLDERWTAL